jgi:hypothetical protein
MEKTIKVTESSDLYKKIDALGLPDAQRKAALASALKVEQLALVIGLVAKLLRLTPGAAVHQPKLRHQ